MSGFLRHIIIGLLILLSVSVKASVQPLPVDLNLRMKGWRWERVKGMKPPRQGVAAQLYQIRKYQLSNKPMLCLKKINTLEKKAKDFRPWLAVARLECSRQIANQDKRSLTSLRFAIAEVERHPQWLLQGPQKEVLRDQVVQGQMQLTQMELLRDRKRAWLGLERLEKMKHWLTDEQLAQVYRWAGELAFMQQKLSMAKGLYERSLNEQESAKLRKKIKSLQTKLIKQKKVDTDQGAEEIYLVAPVVVPVSGMEASDEEKRLEAQMSTALKAGDWFSAVEDGVNLISQFPGGLRSKWASDRLLEVLISVSQQEGDKVKDLRRRINSLLSKLDGGRLYKWSQVLAQRGLYKESYRLAKESLSQLGVHPDSTKVLRVAARSALYAGLYDEAESDYNQLIQKHAGSSAAEEALFRLGLLYLRRNKDSLASSYFEKLLAVYDQSDYEMSTRYWLWRAQQKMNSPRAQTEAQELIRRFPLTYYGLRAQAEMDNGQLLWRDKGSKKVETTLWLFSQERIGWERFKVFVRAGWHREAQAELRALAEPMGPSQKLVYARLWSLAFDHHESIRLIRNALEQDSNYFSWSVLKLAYPQEYKAWIEKESQKNSLDPLLVMSLIRQESAFRKEAKSPANASGLMQLMPATAQGVAQMIKMKGLSIPEDLFDPGKNIQLGTRYLRQMIQAFDGHVPLALAAYNVGIGRLRRWLRTRPELGQVQALKSSQYMHEIWIDEMPWAETTFYVKAILRNWLIYQWLAEKKVVITEPIWSGSTSG